MTCLRHKEIKTRKRHRCSLCHRIIRKGAKCWYYAGIFEGDFQAHYTHAVCEHHWQQIADQTDYEFIDPYEFRHDVLGLLK
jgi:hypothetical protein